MSRRAHVTHLVICLLLAAAATSLWALAEPDRTSTVGENEFRHPDLTIQAALRAPAALPTQAASQAAADLAALGVPANRAFVDVRGGRWGSILPTQPLVPGNGVGNALSWPDGPPANDAALGRAAWDALRGYLQASGGQLRIDASEIVGEPSVTVVRDGTLIQIHGQRVVGGIPVRGSYFTAGISHGNLALFGTQHWGDVNVSTVPTLDADAALAAVQSHVGSYTISGAWGKPSLAIVPMAQGQDIDQIPVGQGYSHRLAWAVRPSFDGEMGRWEALVDAHSGELLAFEDTNHYATTRQVQGGVLPEHNDPSQGPQGTEQAGWPMPNVNVDNAGNTFTTDSGGNLLTCVDGSISTQLAGPVLIMNDNCGAINESTTGNVLDLGTSPGTDCNVAPGASAGNTRASRSGFYEMNRIIEMARAQLPSNTWLPQQLQSNMNINSTCNAFWNGTVNFYRSGGGCSNTGEIAGVYDHEWGHGMDANDATPGISSPGEGIPDIYAAIRLGTSCIGFNFRPGVPCGGYGDPCIAFGGEPACTGVRDINYEKRASQQPHTFSWANGNPSCGSSHCRGAVYSEAVWSLWKRDLPAIYGMDNNTALEVTTRLTFIGAGGVGTWFSGSPPFGGCAATSGYKQYLMADDTNGNLNDGTPHMQAIFAAFDRQEIACNDLMVQDSGCGGTPTTAPSVTATALDRGADLSWGAVAGATEYEIFRTDGVFQCDFGKTKVGSTTGTSFSDSGLQNGRTYYYTVIPKGPSDSCFGPASACTMVTPVAGANLQPDAGSAALVMNTGDGDSFIDNCESGTVSLDVINIGSGTQTNVRIDAVRAISHAGITIDALNAVSPSTLNACDTGNGSFDFTAGGLSFGDTVVFEVDVTSDQLSPGVRTATISFTNAESDVNSVASRTYDFETDLEGWTVIQGTFFRSSSGGGAGGSSWYARTSSNLDNQCDQIRSPAIRLTASTTMQISTNFDIENFSSGSWWDRANVAFFEGGARNSVDPDSGRLYNASGAGATCVTVGQNGWAASMPTWASSGFSATALNSAGRAGQTVQIDVAYGTDVAVVGDGFRFDQLTLTNFEELVPDAQSDVCFVCGDGSCDPGEDQCSCPADCGTPPANETPMVDCSDGVDNDCDGPADCADADCATDPFCANPCDNDGVCEAGEDCNNCSNDCISGTTPGASCGNGVCEAGDGETCVSCPADCNGKVNGKPSGRFCCGLDSNESPPYPPNGCADAQNRCTTGGFQCTTVPQPPVSFCCGDGTCEGSENSSNCAIDCGPPPCGDGFCDPMTENQCSCAVDCGTPPTTETSCTDGQDNDCDGAVDCADADCSGNPACPSCLPKNATCHANNECCSGKCKNNNRCA